MAQHIRNTGLQGWHELEEYFTDTDEASGNDKANVPTDPDYVPPVQNIEDCPLTI